ncbi:hypothetical protein DFS34DRAFT_404381 [Phlyctochytrium arcticum]|nr:hypothetical protein DFS34DRAFT_404381 [Phlyctochytrium arcticum]
MSLLSITAFCVNGFMVVVVLKYKSLKTVQNYLLLNTLITNMLFGLSGIPVQPAIAITGRFVGGYNVCQWSGYTITVAGCQNIFGAFLLSYERFSVIVRRKAITEKQVFKLIATSWTITLSLGSVPHWFGGRGQVFQPSMVYCAADWHSRVFYAQFMAWGCFTIITVNNLACCSLYARIFHEVCLVQKQFASIVGSRKGSTLPGNGGKSQPENARDPERAQEIKNAKKTIAENSVQASIAKKFAVIVGFLITNWTCYHIKFAWEGATGKEVPPFFDALAINMALFNSLCDPTVILILDKRWRSAAYVLLGGDSNMLPADMRSRSGKQTISSSPGDTLKVPAGSNPT